MHILGVHVEFCYSWHALDILVLRAIVSTCTYVYTVNGFTKGYQLCLIFFHIIYTDIKYGQNVKIIKYMNEKVIRIAVGVWTQTPSHAVFTNIKGRKEWVILQSSLNSSVVL